MRLATRFGLLSALGLSLLAAPFGGCGDKPEAPTGPASAAASSAAGSGGGASSSATSSSSGSGGGGPTLYNGCDPATAEDHTMDATVEIQFGGALGLIYKPSCIRVKSGTMVTWTGDTFAHPLDAGLIVKGLPVADPTSPIKPTMGSMPSVTFTIAPAGMYGFFCDDHYGGAMKGVVFAE